MEIRETKKSFKTRVYFAIVQITVVISTVFYKAEIEPFWYLCLPVGIFVFIMPLMFYKYGSGEKNQIF